MTNYIKNLYHKIWKTPQQNKQTLSVNRLVQITNKQSCVQPKITIPNKINTPKYIKFSDYIQQTWKGATQKGILGCALGGLLCLTSKGILSIFGFASSGILKGSMASLYQASLPYGSVTPGSIFALLQSIGAKTGILLSAKVIIPIAISGGVGYYLLYYRNQKVPKVKYIRIGKVLGVQYYGYVKLDNKKQEK